MNERIEIVVLARLSVGAKPPTAAQLATQTQRYKPTTIEDAAWQAAIDGALQRLAQRGAIDGERRVVRNELADRLGAHAAKKWEHWADKLLPAAALGIRLDDAKAMKRLSLANGWAAAVAARQLGLWSSGPPPSLGTLGDAVVWHDLGIVGAPEKCPPKLRAHLLRRHLAIEDAKADSLVRQIAARAVKAPNVTPKELKDAIVRTWLDAAPRAAEPKPAEPTQPEPSSLIADAIAAARDAKAGLWGERKVFVSTVWEALRRQPAWAQLDLDDFKAQLVAAHRDRRVTLSRADYVPAMDPALVAASEIAVDGADYHFIAREPSP